MQPSATPHQGIELDVLDLSGGTACPAAAEASPKFYVNQILKRIRENDSFLSFFVQVRDVNKVLQMKYASASDIADVILKDVALTTKLLKLVNSSFYGQFSTGGVATISEAMIILGTREIKLAAANLKIYELMQDIATLKILRDKALQSLQRSLIARQIAADEGISDAEAIQISAMLYDFGEYLVALFLPDIFVKIEILVEEKGLEREVASHSVMGISYSKLGRFVASRWSLPHSIIHAMKPVTDFNRVKRTLTSEELQQYYCAFSNDLCRVGGFPRQIDSITKIAAITEKYSLCLDIPVSRAQDLVKTSWQKITRHAAILKLDTRHFQE